MAPDRRDTTAAPHRWMVFSLISLVYFFVYFHRVSTSVIVPDLLATFHIGAAALGAMSSMYFYLYALEQPLVGHLVDRFGPRRVIGIWTLAAAAGSYLFAAAPNIWWASIGRALIGIGVGGVYVPAIKAFAQWFRPREFATLLGLLMSVGNLGAVVATSPLAFAAEQWGWRATFLLIGTITLGLAVLTLRFMGERRETEEPETGEPTTGGRAGTRRILATGRFWIFAGIFFGVYGTFITLQGLWATPFLTTVLAVDRLTASQVNMLIPVGVIVGAPFFGWLNEHLSIGKIDMLVAVLTIGTLIWGLLTLCPARLGLSGLAVLLFVLGAATGGFVTSLWGFVRETTPSRILGLMSGLLNAAPVFGGAALQMVTGAILERSGQVGDVYPPGGFRTAFALCLLCNLVCLGLALSLRRQTRPRGG